MSSNYIGFRLSPVELDKLDSAKRQGESMAQAAKRLLVSILTTDDNSDDNKGNTASKNEVDTNNQSTVEACSLPGAIAKLEENLEFVERETESNKAELAKLRRESGERLRVVEKDTQQIKNLAQDLDATTNLLAGEMLDRDKLIAALNESINDLRQDLYTLQNQVAQIQVEQKQIEATKNTTNSEENEVKITDDSNDGTDDYSQRMAFLDRIAVENGMLPPRDTAPSVDAIKPEIVDPLDEVPDWANPTANLLDTIPDWVITLVEYLENNPDEKNKPHKRDFVAKWLKIKTSEVEKHHDTLEKYGCRIIETGIIKDKREYYFDSFTKVVNHILDLQQKTT